jgi:hypothetical protein
VTTSCMAPSEQLMLSSSKAWKRSNGYQTYSILPCCKSMQHIGQAGSAWKSHQPQKIPIALLGIGNLFRRK